jgi:hypothetical protein
MDQYRYEVSLLGLDPEDSRVVKKHYDTRDNLILASKAMISKFSEYKCTIQVIQQIRVYESDGLTRIIYFKNGKRMSSADIKNSNLPEHIIKKSVGIKTHTDKNVTYKVKEFEFQPCERFDCSNPKVVEVVVLVCISAEMAGLPKGFACIRLIMQIMHPNIAQIKEYKQRLLIPQGDQLDIPWKNAHLIELVYYTDQLGDRSWVVEHLAPLIINSYVLHVQDVYLKIAQLGGQSIEEFASGEYAIKNLMPRVITLGHEDLHYLVNPNFKHFTVTEKINGITVACIIENKKLYIAGGNNTYEFKVNGLEKYAFDGELIVRGDDLYVFPFDIRSIGVSIKNEPFYKRMTYLDKLSELKVNPEEKQLHIVSKTWKNLLASDHIDPIPSQFPTDGIILIYNDKTSYGETTKSMYESTKIFKVKDPEQLTLDFYVQRCPANYYGKPPYVERPGEFLAILCCGLDKQLARSMRDIILIDHVSTESQFIPVMFCPSMQPYTHVAYIKDQNAFGNICEFSWKNKAWHLDRIRYDRTNELIRGLSFGNNHKVAELNLLSIYFPIKLTDLKPAPIPVSILNERGVLSNIYLFIQNRYKPLYLLNDTVMPMPMTKTDQYGYGYGDKEIYHLALCEDPIAIDKFIKAKYSVRARHSTYLATCGIKDLKQYTTANYIPVPIKGVELIISMFKIHHYENMIEYISHLMNYRAMNGTIIIVTSKTLHDRFVYAVNKVNLQMKILDYKTTNPKFEDMIIYELTDH